MSTGFSKCVVEGCNNSYHWWSGTSFYLELCDDHEKSWLLASYGDCINDIDALSARIAEAVKLTTEHINVKDNALVKSFSEGYVKEKLVKALADSEDKGLNSVDLRVHKERVVLIVIKRLYNEQLRDYYIAESAKIEKYEVGVPLVASLDKSKSFIGTPTVPKATTCSKSSTKDVILKFVQAMEGEHRSPREIVNVLKDFLKSGYVTVGDQVFEITQ